VPNGAGHVPAGEPQPLELVVWDEFLDQRKELPLLKPDVCVKQFPRRIQRLSINDAGRHGYFERAREPLELHVLDACLAEGSRLRLDVPEEKREELFFLIPKVDTLFVPEELPELPGRRQPSRSIPGRRSTAQPHCLYQSIVMFARERDQGGVALHSTTLIRTRRTTRRTFATTIDFTASDGLVAAGHGTTHLLWNGVPDPEAPNAIFELAFDKLHIRELG
jgi:hypothetical protein